MKDKLKSLAMFVDRKIAAIKFLFVLSVLIFIFFELGRIFKGMSWENIKGSIAGQSPAAMLLLAVLGFVAVIPMLTYDFVVVSFLPAKYSRKYILRSGWITNTFTNIAGFGGFLGATLRANFYNRSSTKKQVVFAISKVALFLLSGLSVCCLFALIALFGFGVGDQFEQYSIWLFGGALYFPALLLLTHFRDSAFFKDLSFKKEIILVLGSTLEWGAAAGFFLLVGAMMGLSVDYTAVFILYVIASIIGVISMVPGGLGSFDVFMLIGLTNLGILDETGVVWLLFFRIFYYILPFIVGIVLFIHDTGRKINTFLDGIPEAILRKTAHGILTLFLYASGIVMLLESTVPNFAFGNSLIVKLYPYTFFFLNQISSVVFAFLLIGVARGIESKVKRAYWLTLIVLAIGIVNTLWRSFSLGMVVFLFVIMMIVFLSRKELYRNHFAYSFGKACFDSVLFVGSFVLYSIVGAVNSPQYTIHHAVPDALFFPSERVWLSGFLGLVFAALIVLLIYRYLSLGDSFEDKSFPEKRVRAVLEKYAGNETSHLAFLRDKRIFFFQHEGEDKLFFMYRKKADKLIIMGEPVGDRSFLRIAIANLMQKADCAGYQLVFYEINSAMTLTLHDLGFDFIKTGEEGYVKLSDFTLSGKKQRAQRALMNKFERQGYRFALIKPPFAHEEIQELKKVSDSWLDSQEEKGFSLGFFDEYYLNQAPIAVIRDAQGQVVAFASLMPSGSKKILSIDLMRHLKEAPSGIMDKIFISLFEYGKENGYEYFNMGMAPLSNVGRSEYSFIEERAAHLIYEYGYHFYGFQGLRSYKNKYVTKWHSKYTAYRKRNSVLITMLQLASVVNQHAATGQSKRALMIAHFFK
ncbi:bifunctional lysylphosphatidylglycerol flippase/synthetase MprF [Liquorilactobacillus satsumensis]|uniref:bifunctional lysylphosphatidylglycerol flippase/synthetase MprF n=1 Tax=Liquorilactobacillus satsumensis TaxID=259059 RepID=UPI0039E7BCC7